MLQVKMTPHLLGIEVSGDYDELNRLYDSVWALVGYDHDKNARTSVQEAVGRERLLGLCYDLRHAYMGSRNVRMEENGMTREQAEWLGISLPPLNNLYYSVEILYPEAMYEVMMLGSLIDSRRAQLIKKSSFSSYDADDPRVLFDPVCAMAAYYQSLVLEAVRSVVTANTFSRIRKQAAAGVRTVSTMYTQWMDLLNCDWCRLSADKRKSKLSTMVRDISDYWNNQEYLDMMYGINSYMRETGAVLANVHLSDAEYPEEYDW